MTDPFVAEIRMLACNFPPAGWAFCDGQLLSISQNTALFSLLGTTFGGDGKSTFALPNLQGAAPMQWGQGPGLTPRDLGESGGTPTVTLSQAQMSHTHALQASPRAADLDTPGPQNALGRSTPATIYKLPAGAVTTQPLAAGILGPPVAGGGNQPHNNMQPYLVLNFCIALQGIYPQRP
jgi:microcystin-dependent protein